MENIKEEIKDIIIRNAKGKHSNCDISASEIIEQLNTIQKENEELREDLGFQIKFKEAYLSHWQNSIKENTKLKETNSALQRFRLEDVDSAMKREGHLAGEVLKLKERVKEFEEEWLNMF